MPLTDNMSIERLHSQMNERRLNGENIFLRQFLSEEFPEFGSQDTQLEKYYYEMGFDYYNTTVSQIVDAAVREPAYGFLFRETVLPALFEALYDDADYRTLLAYSQIDTSATVLQPYVESTFTDTRKKEKRLAPGETPSTHQINIKGKYTTPEDYGDTIEIPYNTIADTRLPVLNYFLAIYALATNRGKLRRVVDVVINGDGATDILTKQKVVNSANILGVRDTEAGLTFRDIKTPCLRMARLGFPVTVAVGPEDIIDDISEFDEMKRPYEGKPLYSFKISGRNLIPSEGLICDDVGAGRVSLISRRGSVAEYLREGLTLNIDQFHSKRIIVMNWNERLSYQKLMRQSSVVIDSNLTFASNGFASYMVPTE